MTLKKRNTTSTEQDSNYDKFLKELSIFDIRLINSSCRLDTGADKKMRTDKRPVPVRHLISTEYELGEVGDQFFNASVHCKFVIQGEKIKAKPVSIDCSFQGHFHTESAIQKKLAERFTQSDLRLVVWPYLREFIQDMTVRMSIPPVVLPYLSRQSN